MAEHEAGTIGRIVVRRGAAWRGVVRDMDVHPALYQACLTELPMNMNIASTLYFPPATMSQHVSVTVIVAMLHFAVFAAWQMQPPRVLITQPEMEISLTMIMAPAMVKTKALPPQPEKSTAVPTQHMDHPALHEEQIATSKATPPVSALAPEPVSAEPTASDIEPDYQASYLNNRLTYPLAARRSGIQGRVILNVEVLAEGVSGQVQIHQSSGYEVLDRAALQSVKTWRFVPARRAGHSVNEWFKIPIKFSLKDNAA